MDIDKNKLFNMDLSDKLGIILFIISVALLIIILTHINQYVWDDEAFTLNLVSQSYLQVINGTAMDVHPPLYYLLLKFVSDITSSFLFFLNISFNQIVVAKLFSITPIILLLIFNFIVLRKKFGWLFSGLFALCLIGMPKMLLYGFQIRMYSWGLLFVTLTFYYSYMITRYSSLKYWFLLIFFGVLGAYTHYFALINTVVIYLLLFVYFLIKNRKEIKKLIISGVISLLLYLPWLFVFFNQIKAHEGSHSTPLLLNELPNFLWFTFSPEIYRTFGNFTIVGLLLIIAYIVLIISLFVDINRFKGKFKQNNNVGSSFETQKGLDDFEEKIGEENRKESIKESIKENKSKISGEKDRRGFKSKISKIFKISEIFENKFLYLGPLLLLGTILLTFLFSKSNFAARYIFTSFGVFWLSFSLLLSQNFSKKKIFVPIFIILLISSSINIGLFLEQQNDHEHAFNQVNAVLNEIKPNDLIVFTNIDVYVSFNKPYLKDSNSIYYNIDHNFYEDKLESRGNYTYSGFTSTKLDQLNTTYEKHQFHGLEEIKKALGENKTVWIFTRNTEKEVLDEIIMKLPGSYKLSEKLVLNEKYPDEALPYPKRIFVISPT